ncbi:unnamed protein product [Urochloa humidicola]
MGARGERIRDESREGGSTSTTPTRSRSGRRSLPEPPAGVISGRLAMAGGDELRAPRHDQRWQAQGASNSPRWRRRTPLPVFDPRVHHVAAAPLQAYELRPTSSACTPRRRRAPARGPEGSHGRRGWLGAGGSRLPWAGRPGLGAAARRRERARPAARWGNRASGGEIERALSVGRR